METWSSGAVDRAGVHERVGIREIHRARERHDRAKRGQIAGGERARPGRGQGNSSRGCVERVDKRLQFVLGRNKRRYELNRRSDRSRKVTPRVQIVCNPPSGCRGTRGIDSRGVQIDVPSVQQGLAWLLARFCRTHAAAGCLRNLAGVPRRKLRAASFAIVCYSTPLRRRSGWVPFRRCRTSRDLVTVSSM